MNQIEHGKDKHTCTFSMRTAEPEGLCVAELTVFPLGKTGLLERELSGWKIDETRPFYFFNRLLVPVAHRQKGLGTQLLKAVVETANEERFYIINAVGAYDTREFPASLLEAFYIKHGFLRVMQNFMIYAPEGVMTVPVAASLEGIPS